MIGEMAKKQERNDDKLLLLFQGMNVSGNNESAKNLKKKSGYAAACSTKYLICCLNL
ncbi:hypothetical protein [Paenibacillus amylolyticus]|jgi:hypothetical protein|uniref:hypothetical protein n=1 Tax=Paenibacillus amylolyticus TaxID=1451 RepID=UPI001374CB01|nr:hypothetical protein [Paenibacillus amylolyticus]